MAWLSANSKAEIDKSALVDFQHPVIAMPSASAAQVQRVVQICYIASLQYRTIPSLRELVSGQFSLGQVREADLMTC